MQEAIKEKVARLERSRLTEECDKLYRVSERKMADEGLSEEAALWPEY